MGDGALFPCDDPAMLFKIEEMLGLGGDFSRAWMPCLYIGMRHTAYGHPEKWAQLGWTVARIAFWSCVAGELHRRRWYWAL